MNRKNELMPLVETAAKAHGLPVALVAAICEVESGWDQYAMRYEPGFRWLVEHPVKPRTCTDATEANAQATSWGLMQLMGANARSLGHQGWLCELTQPAVALDLGTRFLARLEAQHGVTWGWPGVVRAWNTGRPHETTAGIAYAQRILDALGGSWPS